MVRGSTAQRDLNPTLEGEREMTLKLIKAGVATIAMLTACVAAQAADMPIKTPYYKGPMRSVVAYYNWTGFYAGVNAGYGFGTSNWSLPGVSTSPKGVVAGGTLGYNWQAGSIVYGIEGDFDWSGVKGSASCFAVSTCETSNPWLATVRGRLGYAFDRWLPYITAGGAYGNVKATTSAPPPGVPASASKSEFGWTAGAGLEYAMMGNWTAKIEYLYVDLGSFNAATAPLTNNVSFKESLVRVGLNYKFSGPIFSRY
jgi:outer membrane immunogenic protein